MFQKGEKKSFFSSFPFFSLPRPSGGEGKEGRMSKRRRGNGLHSGDEEKEEGKEVRPPFSLLSLVRPGPEGMRGEKGERGKGRR